MAEDKLSDSKKPKKDLKPAKKKQTVRERSSAGTPEKPQRIRKTASKAKAPLKRAKAVGAKEYHLPLPDNKAGKVLKKRVRILPKFFYDALAEVRLVVWPSRKDTLRLTMAVFIFSVIFASFIGGLDYILNIIFKKLFVN